MVRILSLDRSSKNIFASPAGSGESPEWGQTAPTGERKPLMRSVKGCIEQYLYMVQILGRM